MFDQDLIHFFDWCFSSNMNISLVEWLLAWWSKSIPQLSSMIQTWTPYNSTVETRNWYWWGSSLNHLMKRKYHHGLAIAIMTRLTWNITLIWQKPWSFYRQEILPWCCNRQIKYFINRMCDHYVGIAIFMKSRRKNSKEQNPGVLIIV